MSNNISDTKTGVEVVIEDLNGNVLSTFDATDSQSFVQMAEDHDLEMPVSCCSGACFVCACKIKEGQELIDIAKISVPLVDIDEDQVLACVGGVKQSAFSDGTFHRIVLQKLM